MEKQDVRHFLFELKDYISQEKTYHNEIFCIFAFWFLKILTQGIQ